MGEFVDEQYVNFKVCMSGLANETLWVCVLYTMTHMPP